jgi:hypothetical protein
VNRSIWLACLVSVAVHAALLTALLYLPGPGDGQSSRPLAIDTVIIDDEMHVSLAEPRELVFDVKLTPLPAPSQAAPAPVPTIAAPESNPLDIQPASGHEAAGPASEGSKPQAAPAQGSMPGGNGGATTSFFAVPTRARSVVYVIDRSVSMGLNGALDAVKRELLASLARLPGDARFQVVYYNRRADLLNVDGNCGLLAASPAHKVRVDLLLDRLQAEGGTDHVPALTLALSMQPDVIYFLTDADDLTPTQARSMTLLNHGRCVIHTIELTTANRAHVDMPLQVLARENRGMYRGISLSTVESRAVFRFAPPAK